MALTSPRTRTRTCIAITTFVRSRPVASAVRVFFRKNMFPKQTRVMRLSQRYLPRDEEDCESRKLLSQLQEDIWQQMHQVVFEVQASVLLQSQLSTKGVAKAQRILHENGGHFRWQAGTARWPDQLSFAQCFTASWPGNAYRIQQAAYSYETYYEAT